MKRQRLVALLPLCAGVLVVVGCTGPTGLTGATGPQGPMGMTGPQGSSGLTGVQGSPGLTGAQGSTGMTGVQGSAGMSGVQGPAGLTGAQGMPAPAPMPAIRWTSLKEILFDFDKTDIRYSESRKPAEIAAYMSQNPSVRLGIDGYTDLRATGQYNLPLNQHRVATVRDALIQAGVRADRIETDTFDSDRPMCNPSTGQCSQLEGRVEVLIRASNEPPRSGDLLRVLYARRFPEVLGSFSWTAVHQTSLRTGIGRRSTRQRSGPTVEWRERTRRGGPGQKE